MCCLYRWTVCGVSARVTGCFVLYVFVVHAAVFLLASTMADGVEPRVGQGVGNSLANTDDLLSVGIEFKSYEDLSSVIKSYEQRHFVTLYKRSLRTIQAARKRAPNRHFAEPLVYSEVDFACVHGGRDYVSRSKGKRKISSLIMFVYVPSVYSLGENTLNITLPIVSQVN